MKKKAKTIWETDSYNEIEPHYLNRKIKTSHTKTLVEQIRYRDLGSSVPIILNENNMIIDGHHRFKAREQLGLNIFYVNHHGLVEEDIIMLNVNRSEWTTLEAGVFYNSLYKETYDEQYKDYPKWIEFYKNHMKHSPLSMNIGLSLLANDRHEAPTKAFKAGALKIQNYEQACEIATFMNKSFRYTHGKSGEALSRALWFIWRIEDFESDKFIKLMEKKSDKFKNLATLNKVEWWIQFIENEILDYTVMTKWRKFNHIGDGWLTFFYKKTIKSKDKDKEENEKLIVNLG